MIRWISVFIAVFQLVAAVSAASVRTVVARRAMSFIGMPGRPGTDMVITENTLACDQLRCNGLRTGQVPFSGPTLKNEETCVITQKSFSAPFFLYEDNRFFHVISTRGELWKFDYRLQLRDRFSRARFPALEGVRMQEGVYLLVGNREISLRQTSGNVVWSNAYGPPSMWFPPLRINEQFVIVHGNAPGPLPASRRSPVPVGVMRVLQVSSGKTLLDVPMQGAYASQRFPLLAVLQNQKVIVPAPGGELRAFSVSDLLKKKNRVLWQVRPPGSGSILSITGDPAASRVYVARAGVQGEKNISAINTDTGALVWLVPMESISTPLALYKNMIFFGTQFGRIVGLDTTNGKILMDATPELSLAPDDETRVMAITEPVVDSLGRVYVAFAAVPLNLAALIASNRPMAGGLDDAIEAEVVGIQTPGRQRVYLSASFEIHDLQWGKLFLGMESVGLFTQPDRMDFCAPEREEYL